MTSRYLSVALPPELYAEVEAAGRRERRSRAAIVRDALALYLARPIPVEEPTPEEFEAIREGKALARGEYVSLGEWRRDVGLDRERPAQKDLRAVPGRDLARIDDAFEQMHGDP